MKNIYKILAILFWIGVWQLLGLLVGNEIFLATPVKVGFKLLELSITFEFWASLWFSFVRIICGFFIGAILGVLLAGIAYKFKAVQIILWPLIAIIKAAPVVSFIILFLILVSSRNLSILISFLMVLPIIYTNVLKGLENTDVKLLEMSKVFKVSKLKKILYIFIPSLYPFFYSACQVSLGLCWKSGITAELIGYPNGSIGEKLYQAKLYLDTGELFAWTIVIILISVAFEKLFLYLVNHGMKRFERI